MQKPHDMRVRGALPTQHLTWWQAALVMGKGLLQISLPVAMGVQ